VRIVVRGRPAPQGSKRHVGGGRMIEMSKAVGPWREAVRTETQLAMRHEPPLGCPVEVNIMFYLKRPASHYRTGRNAHLLRDNAPEWPAGKPDLDKLARAVLDGLTMGGAWKDDSQAVRLDVIKLYAVGSHAPGCIINLAKAG